MSRFNLRMAVGTGWILHMSSSYMFCFHADPGKIRVDRLFDEILVLLGHDRPPAARVPLSSPVVPVRDTPLKPVVFCLHNAAAQRVASYHSELNSIFGRRSCTKPQARR